MVAFATAILLNLLSMAFERRPVKRQLCFLAAYISGVAFIYEFLAWKRAAPIYITAAGRPISLLRWGALAWRGGAASRRASSQGHQPVSCCAGAACFASGYPPARCHHGSTVAAAASGGGAGQRRGPRLLTPAQDVHTCKPGVSSALGNAPLLHPCCLVQIRDVGARYASHDLRPQHDI